MRISLKVKDVNLVTVFGTSCPKNVPCTWNAWNSLYLTAKSIPIPNTSWNYMIHSAALETCNSLLLNVPKNIKKKTDSKHSHSITLLFTVWTISGLLLVYECRLGAMPCQAIGQWPPFFSSHSPATSSLQCQAGLKQTERFSLASHQLPQRRVKQAVAGLAVPSATILLSHMGIAQYKMTLDQQGVHAAVLTREERFRKRNNNYCRPDRGMCFGLFQGRVLPALSQILRPRPPRVTKAAAADMHRAPGHTSKSPPSIRKQ